MSARETGQLKFSYDLNQKSFWLALNYNRNPTSNTVLGESFGTSISMSVYLLKNDSLLNFPVTPASPTIVKYGHFLKNYGCVSLDRELGIRLIPKK